jgi:hypothetical protein
MKRVESLIQVLKDPVFTVDEWVNYRDGGIDYKVVFRITHGRHFTPEELQTSPLYGTGELSAEVITDMKIEILQKLYGKLSDIVSEYIEDTPEDMFIELDDFFGGLL